MSEERRVGEAIGAWLRSEADGRAPDRVFETVFAATRTSGQIGEWRAGLDRLRAALLGRTTGRLALLGLTALIVGGLLIAGAAWLNRPPQSPPPARAVSAAVLGTTCAHPSAVIAAGGSAWVMCVDQTRRFDAATGQVTGAVAGPLVAVDAAGAWASTGRQIEALDTVSAIPTDHLAIKGASALALDSGSLWVAEGANRSVTRIDRATRAIVGTIGVGGAPTAVVTDGAAVWVALAAERQIARIDPATNLVAAQFDVPAADGLQLAAGRVWVLDSRASILYAIDALSGAITGRIELPNPLWAWTGLTTAGSSLLVAGGHEVATIDPSAGVISDLLSISNPQPVALGAVARTTTGLLLVDTQGERLLAVAP
jgi:hypothetical protein